MNDEPQAVNTDVELWREVEDDCYSPSIHVTKSKSIGIDVGGSVYVKPLREWHRLAKSKDEEIAGLRKELEEVKGICDDGEIWHVHGRGGKCYPFYDSGSTFLMNAKDWIERRKQAGEEISELKAHNLELTQALKEAHEEVIRRSLRPYPAEEKVKKALSHPTSRKYLAMIEVVEAAKVFLTSWQNQDNDDEPLEKLFNKIEALESEEA